MTVTARIVILVLMLYFLLFIAEIIMLLFLSKRLIHSLAEIIYRFTKSHRAVVSILAIIFLPGTIFHELAHLLFAGVMLVPVGEMNVIPEAEGEGIKLGSVQIGQTDPLRRVIIGLAPVLFGLFFILAALYLVRSADHFIWWQVLLVLYLVFEIGNTMFSSKRDLEGLIGFGIAIALVTILVVVVLYFLIPGFLQKILLWLSHLNLEAIVAFFKITGIYLIVPVVLDLLIILATKPLTSRN